MVLVAGHRVGRMAGIPSTTRCTDSPRGRQRIRGGCVCIVFLNLVWSFVRYRFVSPLLADLGSDVVHLKWPVSLCCGWLLWRKGVVIPALLAGGWPVVTLVLMIFSRPTRIGTLQNMFMASIGYDVRGAEAVECSE
jgi:hypothetical protein